MKYIIYVIVIIILAGLQVGLFGFIKLFGAVPNLLLLFVVGCCLQRDTADSFFVALIAGLFLGFSSSILVGSYSLVFLVLAALLYFIIYRLVVFELNWKYLLAVAAGATIFVEICVWGISKLGTHYAWSAVSLDIFILRRNLVFEVIYNLLLIYPIYLLATSINHIILRLQGKKYRIG